MFKFVTAIFLLLSAFNLFSSPEISYEKGVMIDQEIHIEVIGLEHEQIVEIEARWNANDNIQWRSSAQFQADENGVIRLAAQAPIAGSYEGIDPMGLFWSMQMGNIIPGNEKDVSLYAGNEEGGWYFSTNLRVLDGRSEIVTQEIRRFIRKAEVELTEVHEEGLIGRLFIPPGSELTPVVIVLTGSNGGMPTLTAATLATHGVATLALAYSGMEGLPPSVEDVPLEYFETAFAWIKAHPLLNGRIALFGTSRGAELALLLGSMFPDEIERIVALAPSSVVLSPNSWTYRGETVLPAAPYLVDLNSDYEEDSSTCDHPRSPRIYRERGFLIEKERYDAARLPVENIRCPIMLISGGDDQLGPCSLYAKQILERLDLNQSTIERIHLDYPAAGHLISIPYFPRVNILCDEDLWLNLGGTPLADEFASRDAWKKLVEFLKSSQGV